MSKQSDAKLTQGYEQKPVPETCANCQFFEFDNIQTVAPSTWNPKGYFEDKNLRCGIGGFAVKKTATCDKFEMRGLAVKP